MLIAVTPPLRTTKFGPVKVDDAAAVASTGVPARAAVPLPLYEKICPNNLNEPVTEVLTLMLVPVPSCTHQNAWSVPIGRDDAGSLMSTVSRAPISSGSKAESGVNVAAVPLMLRHTRKNTSPTCGDGGKLTENVVEVSVEA
jgi:hypothetical protein